MLIKKNICTSDHLYKKKMLSLLKFWKNNNMESIKEEEAYIYKPWGIDQLLRPWVWSQMVTSLSLLIAIYKKIISYFLVCP